MDARQGALPRVRQYNYHFSNVEPHLQTPECRLNLILHADLAHPPGVVLNRGVQRQRLVEAARLRGAVPPHAPHGTLPNLHKVPMLTQQSHGNADEVIRQAIESTVESVGSRNECHTAAKGCRIPGAGERARLPCHTAGQEERVLLGTTGRRLHPDAQPAGVLGGDQTDATGPRVQQRYVDALRPRNEPASVHCAPSCWQRACFREGLRATNRCQQPTVGPG
eukprot:scaffold291310_cov31-Tisochrysis_lutea.AAC.7